MAEEENRSSGGHGGLYFIVGILVAAVAVLGFLYANGDFAANRDVNVNIEGPKSDKAPAPKK